jgi:hypothetical protein
MLAAPAIVRPSQQERFARIVTAMKFIIKISVEPEEPIMCDAVAAGTRPVLASSAVSGSCSAAAAMLQCVRDAEPAQVGSS